MSIKGIAKIVGIDRSSIKSENQDKIAALAYKYWLARGFQDGSPEEDLMRALCAFPGIQISYRQGAPRKGAHRWHETKILTAHEPV